MRKLDHFIARHFDFLVKAAVIFLMTVFCLSLLLSHLAIRQGHQNVDAINRQYDRLEKTIYTIEI